MSGSLIANRYARALIKVAAGDDAQCNKFLAFLKATTELFQMPDVAKLLKSPVMPSHVKRAVLAYAVQQSEGGDDSTKFYEQLLEAGRVSILPEIADAFMALLDARRGIVHAKIISSRELSTSDLDELGNTLSKVFKNSHIVHNVVSPEILGGVVIQIGNKAIDLSVKSKLETAAIHAQQ
jgi:F-type H+-transporting ATPase subunit delta